MNGVPCGVVVAVGGRVAALARAAEILVTRTVVDLVAGAGLQFADRGSYSLGANLEDWHVYAVCSPACHNLPGFFVRTSTPWRASYSLIDRRNCEEGCVPSMLHITPWERTALQLLAVGEGNEAIASRLRIGAHEVEAYLAGLFERLGAANRTEAVAAALRRGLLGSGLTTT